MNRQALVISNLGTPDSPQTKDVRKYLRQFLMDPYVIDIPWPLRFLLVNGVIAPFRSPKSAEAYASIWQEEGSPLLVNSERLFEKLKQHLPQWNVQLGMRYGSPTLDSAFSAAKTSDEIYFIPLYPQYALSSTETSLQELRNWVAQEKFRGSVFVRKDFFADPGFVGAVASTLNKSLETFEPDHVLLSFHGLPVRHVRKVAQGCMESADCCERSTSNNRWCYRHQCFQTAKAVAAQMQWSADQYTVSFQSRLGRDPWIPPYTDHVLTELARRGVRKLAVVCPSFVADCLETLEEIAIREAERFREAGGQELKLIPCVNDSDQWVQALAGMATDKKGWIPLDSP